MRGSTQKFDRLGEHQNAFGFLRLLFASLVIVSHVPEIVFGNAVHEILYSLTGTMTFGGFAVSGFFIISGYLLSGSLLNNASVWPYIVNRTVRIYPAFIIASIMCLVFVAPLSGATLEGSLLHAVISSVFHMLILARPVADHAFAFQNYNDRGSALNGAMWTIQYEAFCYVILLGLSLTGALRRRWITPAIAMLLIAIGTFGAGHLPRILSDARLFSGSPAQLFLLPGMFLSGTSFSLYRDRLVFTNRRVVFAVLAFAVGLFSRYTYAFSFAVFGSYLIFAVARKGAGTRIGAINNRTDISYGVYLYAWPAEQLLIRYMGAGSLVVLGGLTWGIAVIAGWLSWTFVEKPSIVRLRHHRSKAKIG